MPGKRMKRERHGVEVMIRMYCRRFHGIRDALCPQCAELLQYALERLDRCPFGEDKPLCQDCPVHCYKASMRKAIREIMRYAGPRMFFRHPVIAFMHLKNEYRDRGDKKGPWTS
jgi:hypothetical protein